MTNEQKNITLAKAICEAGYMSIIVEGTVWLALTFNPCQGANDYAEINGYDISNNQKLIDSINNPQSQTTTRHIIENLIFPKFPSYNIALHPKTQWIWFKNAAITS